MKAVLTICIVIMSAIHLYKGPELRELRLLYVTAASARDSTSKLTALLFSVDRQSAPILICYKGAAQMMEVKYAVGPIGKYQRFNAGKKLIEYAMTLDSSNLEMRYLRFTIQKSVPSFLGYNVNEITDKNFLLNNYNATADKQLKGMVSGFLLSSGDCTATELKKLRN